MTSAARRISVLAGHVAAGSIVDHRSQLVALQKDLVKLIDRMNCNPIFVRLAWHDSGTYDQRIPTFPERGGANGGIVHDPHSS